MSDLNDPRVLFAAERTLLAWNRTASGLMAFGFFVDRASLMTGTAAADRAFAAWIGLAFLLLGALLNVLSVVQYRRGVASLRPVEIPPRYLAEPRRVHQPRRRTARLAAGVFRRSRALASTGKHP